MAARRPRKPSLAEFVAAKRGELLREVRRRMPPLLPDDSADDFVQIGLTRLTPRYRAMPSQRDAFIFALSCALNAMVSELRKVVSRDDEDWKAEVAARQATREPPPLEEVVELLTTVERLPTRQRRAIELYYMGNMSRREAARDMAVSEDVLKGLLQRGLEALRRDLGPLSGPAAWRLRRPTWLTATTVPRLLVPTLAFAVLTTPFSPRPLPHSEAYVRPVAPETRTEPTNGPAPLERVGQQDPATRAVPVAPTPQQPSTDNDDYVGTSKLPGLGFGVGGERTGRLEGDELCAEPGQEALRTCTNQSLVGVCPITQQLAAPGTSCRRYSEPMVEPFP